MPALALFLTSFHSTFTCYLFCSADMFLNSYLRLNCLNFLPRKRIILFDSMNSFSYSSLDFCWNCLAKYIVNFVEVNDLVSLRKFLIWLVGVFNFWTLTSIPWNLPTLCFDTGVFFSTTSSVSAIFSYSTRRRFLRRAFFFPIDGSNKNGLGGRSKTHIPRAGSESGVNGCYS